MGRPSKLDDVTAERIVKSVSEGMTWALAARSAGVGPSTLREWKQRARDGEERYAAFLARLERAEVEAAQQALSAIRAAGLDPKHWTANAWFLERRFPTEFGRTPAPVADLDAPSEESADDLAMAESVVAALKSRSSA